MYKDLDIDAVFLYFRYPLQLAKTDVVGIDFSHKVIVKTGVMKSVDISFRSNPCMFYTQGCFHVFLRVLPTPDDEVRNLCSLAMRCLSGKNDLLLDLIMEPRLTTRLADVI